MPEVRVLDSLAAVDRGQWRALFPGAAEDYDYLAAVEAAGLKGFQWRYAVAYEDDRLVAAAPGFTTAYPLDTTLTGVGRRVADSLRRVLPDALTLRLACLGSPCTETAILGVAPGAATPPTRLVRALIEAFEDAARRDGCRLMGVKDVAEPDRAAWAPVLGPLGYGAIPGQPIARLPIDFASVDDYLARLSSGVRKDMRRKLRALGRVHIEVRANVDDVIGRIMQLYAQTLARAEMSFEELTPEFFTGVLARMPGRAACVLYYEGGDLLAVNLLVEDGDTLIDKFFCMDAARGRPFNLYFLSWFTNLRLCLARGRTVYQAGQAAYDNKLRLGCTLTRTSNHFRHRNALVNGALRLVAPMFGADPTLRDAA
jgi:predicted N-acyltransferase